MVICGALPLPDRETSPPLISLKSYQRIEDAWRDGIEAWCRAAPDFVLGGGRAWMVTASDGQANWVKRRLLRANVSLFGVQFLDARALRRELCQRHGLATLALGQETLEFLLRLRALAAAREGGSPRCAAAARHPGTCLAALDDYAAAGWLDDPGLLEEILPEELGGFPDDLRALAAWTPDIDHRLRRAATTPEKAAGAAWPPLSVCVFGWDANAWPEFDLLRAAVGSAGSAYLFMPSPRGTSEGLQQGWLEACEAVFGTGFETCDASDFVSAQAGLAERLEGASLDAPSADEAPAPPELLTGVDGDDVAVLVRDFAARWLLEGEGTEEDRGGVGGGTTVARRSPATAGSRGAGGPIGKASDPPPSFERLAILCPSRNPSAVAVVRALTRAGICVEDELGEIAEPGLDLQIQRAVLDYHLNRGGMDPLLTLVELLNRHAAATKEKSGKGAVLRDVFPLDPVEVRRALHGAFAEVQHHDARVLCDAGSFARAVVARPLRRLITHLESWAETLPWREALRRWCECLGGLGVTIDALEPRWSQLQTLPVADPVPSEAFFRYLNAMLECSSARRPPEAAHRFARVVVTTLEKAAGQTWGGVVLLDSNEGSWPLYPPENPFFDDAVRARFNARRTEEEPEGDGTRPGHLLTSADRAQLEHFRFLETLENCTGPLAFASLTTDPAETNRELYPNEWLLRCLVESDRGPARDEKLLDRWRGSIRQTVRARPRLAASERTHLQKIHTRRRDPEAPFDDFFFNFQSLTGPDELPWADAWSAGELDAVWNQPATFAVAQIFGVEPWREKGRGLVRGESWMVGRLVHRWVEAALGLSREPRRFRADDWSRAIGPGLARACSEAEAALRISLARSHRLPEADAPLPLWWQGVLRKTGWAASRCLESLAETALREGENTERWLSLNRTFRAELGTHEGPLRLQARCDLVLLDRPEMAGAACQLLDIRTGAAPAPGSLTAAKVQSGRGLTLAATLFMARAEGADPTKTHAGVIGPDGSNVSLVNDESAAGLEPVLDRLARQQRTLVFGQKGAVVDTEGHAAVENLPLATVPIDPAILARKAERTAG